MIETSSMTQCALHQTTVLSVLTQFVFVRTNGVKGVVCVISSVGEELSKVVPWFNQVSFICIRTVQQLRLPSLLLD